MKFTSIIFFSVLILTACETEVSNNNPNGQSPEIGKPQEDSQKAGKDTSKLEANWLCIPNKQVGLIKADADEESIIAAYGKENVIREEVGIGEGEMAAATIVFPKTDNELIVEWEYDFEYKKLSRIRIEQENAKWETEEGIKIGTTLEELLGINGKAFNFYGFDWDYGGITNEWEDGNINSQLTVFLDTKNPKGTSPELSGDGVFSSSHPKAKEAELEVVAFIIYFGL